MVNLSYKKVRYIVLGHLFIQRISLGAWCVPGNMIGTRGSHGFHNLKEEMNSKQTNTLIKSLNKSIEKTKQANEIERAQGLEGQH